MHATRVIRSIVISRLHEQYPISTASNTFSVLLLTTIALLYPHPPVMGTTEQTVASSNNLHSFDEDMWPPWERSLSSLSSLSSPGWNWRVSLCGEDRDPADNSDGDSVYSSTDEGGGDEAPTVKSIPGVVDGFFKRLEDAIPGIYNGAHTFTTTPSTGAPPRADVGTLSSYRRLLGPLSMSEIFRRLVDGFQQFDLHRRNVCVFCQIMGKCDVHKIGRRCEPLRTQAHLAQLDPSFLSLQVSMCSGCVLPQAGHVGTFGSTGETVEVCSEYPSGISAYRTALYCAYMTLDGRRLVLKPLGVEVRDFRCLADFGKWAARRDVGTDIQRPAEWLTNGHCVVLLFLERFARSEISLDDLRDIK